MDFNKILNSKTGNRGDELTELRNELIRSNQLIIDYIDSSRAQMQAMSDRINHLESLLKVQGQSIEAFDGIVRNL